LLEINCELYGCQEAAKGNVSMKLSLHKIAEFYGTALSSVKELELTVE
jgi:hypothetical protein